MSYSRISTYLNCPLKYRLRYIERMEPERLAIALPFGIAIHRALERRYHVLMTRGQPKNLATLQELFVETLNLEIEATTVPVTYKKAVPDPGSARDMGRRMLEVFHRGGDIAANQILDVELPLSAELLDENNEPTGVKLIGVIDLLIQDSAGELAVVDHKTDAQARTQATVDDYLQLSAYHEIQLAKRKKEAQPKVEYYNKFAKPDGSSTFSAIAKHIGWEPFKFTTQLRKDKLIYEQDGIDIPFQKYVDKGFFEVSIRSDGNNYQAQTRVTAKGVHYLAGRYGKSEQPVESKKQPTTAGVMPKLRLIKTSA